MPSNQPKFPRLQKAFFLGFSERVQGSISIRDCTGVQNLSMHQPPVSGYLIELEVANKWANIIFELIQPFRRISKSALLGMGFPPR
jgi:hypothetical protein